MNRIRNKDHRTGTYEINKISLSCFDDKIFVQENGYDGLEILEIIRKKTVTLITILKNFFVEHIILVFSLIRTASLSRMLNLKNVKHL